jgi:hypothetical protein
VTSKPIVTFGELEQLNAVEDEHQARPGGNAHPGHAQTGPCRLCMLIAIRGERGRIANQLQGTIDLLNRERGQGLNSPRGPIVVGAITALTGALSRIERETVHIEGLPDVPRS